MTIIMLSCSAVTFCRQSLVENVGERLSSQFFNIANKDYCFTFVDRLRDTVSEKIETCSFFYNNVQLVR